MAECYNIACPYCVDYQCRRTCTCDKQSYTKAKMVERMTNETYEKLQAELSQLLNTEKYKQLKNKDKEVYKQAVLACKSVASHYAEKADNKQKAYNDGYYDGYRDGAYGKAYKIDEFKQAVRDEAWLDKVREAESERDDDEDADDAEEGED